MSLGWTSGERKGDRHWNEQRQEKNCERTESRKPRAGSSPQKWKPLRQVKKEGNEEVLFGFNNKKPISNFNKERGDFFLRSPPGSALKRPWEVTIN